MFFPSRRLGLAFFPLAERLFPLCEGVLHGFIVEAFGLEHQLFGIQELRFEPRPSQLFRCHPVVFEKSAGCEGCGSEDAHPADFLAAHQRAQAEIDADRHADCQQRADKLPGR